VGRRIRAIADGVNTNSVYLRSETRELYRQSPLGRPSATVLGGFSMRVGAHLFCYELQGTTTKARTTYQKKDDSKQVKVEYAKLR
jgi:hypothetical protein